MLFLKLLIFFTFSNLIASWEDNDQLIVQINDGKVMGRYMMSKTGLPVRAFLGIPFAAPPVGNLRFKAPQKIEPWEEVKKTQIDGPVCTQMNPFGRVFDVATGQEDCLNLNVYTPAGKRLTGDKLPVIYWIHGGGWTRGEASNFMYGHEHILDHDVIFVTGNYRVGPLGFLSTEDGNSPGNYAFKDQSFILTWIQENIEHFGGDKNSVTIWGESAGGASVNYHMISPLSKGKFHRAISHSGALNQCWSDPARKGAAREMTNKLANELNCQIATSEEIITCLRNVPASNLTLAMSKLYSWDYDPVILFPPVVEDFPTNEMKFIESRNFNVESTNIPWLTGMNTEEGLLKLAAILENENFYNELIEKWDEILPYTFYYYDINITQQAEVTKKINKFYFGDENPVERDTQAVINLWTDGWFIGFIEALKERFSYGPKSNTFIYLFTHKSTASFSQTSRYYGTSHVDDLIPFFPMRKNIFYSSKPTKEDHELASILPLMWVNFAKTGNPNIVDGFSPVPSWSTVNSIPFTYLQIGNENGKSTKLYENKVGLLEERGNFWIDLRANYSLNRWK